LRLVEPIASDSDRGEPARTIRQTPWQLDAARLAAACPRRRDLASAWLLLRETGGEPEAEPLPLDAFTALMGNGEDPSQRAACWLWLHGGQSLFRWRHGSITALAPAELRRLRRERRRASLEAERQRHWNELLRLRQPLPSELQLGDTQNEELQLLRQWAAGVCEQPLSERLKRSLQQAHCAPEPGAIRHLLVDLGQWSRHHLPALALSAWQLGFSADQLAEADRLLTAAESERPGDARRLDLCQLHTVTIDDDDTADIDDGLALETLADGRQRIWIHIADPDRLIEAGSPLDLEARRRASSLYLARGTLPMFPLVLSTGPLSLRSGRRCAAWSLAVVLDAEGAVAEAQLERTWIKPAYRLAYTDADELIELAPPQEADLLDLHRLLLLRRSWRLRQGALQLDQPEGRIRCREDGDGQEPRAELEIIEPSASRQLVAEAMILAGAVVAEHGRRHALALPYRSQPAAPLPSEQELEPLPPGPVRHAAIRRCLSRGHMGFRPAPHFSLGLEAYVQATSPIRRYGDLVVWRQILGQRGGGELLSEAELEPLLAELEGPLRQGIQISRDDQRHWQQVWFQQQAAPQWNGLFLRWLREQDRLGLVHLEDLALDLPALCPARSTPGDALLVRVREVDPLRDRLRLEAGA
jgi:exoribonuclease-2